jgi:hypothetical protein
MSRFGLPAATFLIPEGNPFSPFAADILLHRSFDVPRPLTRESQSRTARLALNLNGDLAPWRWTFTAAYDHARSESHTDTGLLTAEAQGRIDAGDPALDPFARDLDLAASRTLLSARRTSHLQQQLEMSVLSTDAEPPIEVPRLPKVPIPCGVIAVSLALTFTSAMFTPRTSAAICARLVSCP